MSTQNQFSIDWYGASMDDAALVGLALASPQQGVAAIYERYGTSLYNYCYSILRSQADAGDALQESFVTVMGKLGQLRDPSKLRPWLYAIARNHCYKQHRQRSRERPEDSFETGDEQTVMSASTAEPTPGAELVSMVWEATSGLSEVDRSVLELNIRHELDGEELAASLGVPGPKCSVMLHRAKDRLKTAVGALIVSKVGADACVDLAGIVDGTTFNPLVRKRVSRHITKCAVCEETERRHRPEAYLAAVPLLSVPPSVHQNVLTTIKAGIDAASTTHGSEPGAGQSGTAANPGGSLAPQVAAEPVGGGDDAFWNEAGFPQLPNGEGPLGDPAGDTSRALRVAAVVGCVIALVVLLALLNPFTTETTVVAGPVPVAEPTALSNAQFLPTPTAPPTDSTTAAGAGLAVVEPTATPEPTAVPATPAPRPTQPPATQPPATQPTTVPPTAISTSAPTPTLTPQATPTVSPSPTPTPTSQPTATPVPGSTPVAPPAAPTSGPAFVDFVAPQLNSFTVSCGDPFRLTVTVSDNVDTSPTVDLEATWEDESEPALPLTKLSGNTYRATVPRSELDGEHIEFFVRGTLRDTAGNTRLVDVSDDCTIIG